MKFTLYRVSILQVWIEKYQIRTDLSLQFSKMGVETECWCRNPNELVSDSISDPCIIIKFVWWEAAGWSPRIFSDYEQNIHEHIIFKLTINKYLKLQRMVRGAGSFSGINSPTLKSVMGFTRKTKYAVSHMA